MAQKAPDFVVSVVPDVREPMESAVNLASTIPVAVMDNAYEDHGIEADRVPEINDKLQQCALF